METVRSPHFRAISFGRNMAFILQAREDNRYKFSVWFFNVTFDFKF